MICLGKQAGWGAIDKSFVENLKGRFDEDDWQKPTHSGSENSRSRIGPFSQEQLPDEPGPTIRLLLHRFEPTKERFDGTSSKLGWPLQLPLRMGVKSDESRGIHNDILKMAP